MNYNLLSSPSLELEVYDNIKGGDVVLGGDNSSNDDDFLQRFASYVGGEYNSEDSETESEVYGGDYIVNAVSSEEDSDVIEEKNNDTSGYFVSIEDKESVEEDNIEEKTSIEEKNNDTSGYFEPYNPESDEEEASEVYIANTIETHEVKIADSVTDEESDEESEKQKETETETETEKEEIVGGESDEDFSRLNALLSKYKEVIYY